MVVPPVFCYQMKATSQKRDSGARGRNETQALYLCKPDFPLKNEISTTQNAIWWKKPLNNHSLVPSDVVEIKQLFPHYFGLPARYIQIASKTK